MRRANVTANPMVPLLDSARKFPNKKRRAKPQNKSLTICFLPLSCRISAHPNPRMQLRESVLGFNETPLDLFNSVLADCVRALITVIAPARIMTSTTVSILPSVSANMTIADNKIIPGRISARKSGTISGRFTIWTISPQKNRRIESCTVFLSLQVLLIGRFGKRVRIPRSNKDPASRVGVSLKDTPTHCSKFTGRNMAKTVLNSATNGEVSATAMKAVDPTRTAGKRKPRKASAAATDNPQTEIIAITGSSVPSAAFLGRKAFCVLSWNSLGSVIECMASPLVLR
jgi:hypothetical protein